MAVEFQDFSIQVKEALEDAAIAYLHEAGGEMVSQTKQNSRVGTTGQTKNAWAYKVDESKLEAKVGNPLENAIWEEFGTGEYAVKQNGRKKGWWIPVGNGGISSSDAKRYKWEKVRKDKDGNITFVFTYGKKPNPALKNAFITLKPALINRAEQIVKARLK